VTDKKQEFADRWKSAEGRKEVDMILSNWMNGVDIKSLDFISQHRERFDLRGFQMPQPRTRHVGKIGRMNVEELSHLSEFENIELDNIDLSYCRLRNSRWTKCTFNDVIFSEADLKDTRTWGCTFRNVSFRKADLSDSNLGGHIKGKTNSYMNVDFGYADLRNTSYSFPLFQDCDFSFANINSVDFNGSRFKNCRFAGTLDSTIFRGYSAIGESYQRFSGRKHRNLMENVDFSRAELRGVLFTHGIDLSSVLFPDDDSHLVLNNQRATFKRARRIIEDKWKNEDRRIGLNLIDKIHLTNEKKRQSLDLLNKDDHIEFYGERFAEKFFDLIIDQNRK
jgi:uncharacterized protein YjbI with pentapeptide repeats